jgi:hypothetical protein
LVEVHIEFDHKENWAHKLGGNNKRIVVESVGIGIIIFEVEV